MTFAEIGREIGMSDTAAIKITRNINIPKGRKDHPLLGEILSLRAEGLTQEQIGATVGLKRKRICEILSESEK